MLDKTMTFSLGEDKEQEMKQILTTVYDALREKGYNIHSLAIIDKAEPGCIEFREETV